MYDLAPLFQKLLPPSISHWMQFSGCVSRNSRLFGLRIHFGNCWIECFSSYSLAFFFFLLNVLGSELYVWSKLHSCNFYLFLHRFNFSFELDTVPKLHEKFTLEGEWGRERGGGERKSHMPFRVTRSLCLTFSDFFLTFQGFWTKNFPTFLWLFEDVARETYPMQSSNSADRA